MPATLPDLSGFLTNKPSVVCLSPWPTVSPSPGDRKKHDLFVGHQFFRATEANSFDTEARLRGMVSSVVDVQIPGTVSVLFFYDQPAEPVTILRRHPNNHIAQACHSDPGKCIGLGTLPLQDIDASITELRRCKPNLGLRGVETGTSIDNISLDDAKLDLL